MRALTLTQPWAGLVASGIKLVENRPRKIAPRDLFGQRFAIHASREIDQPVYERIRELAPEYCPNVCITVDLPWYKLSRITSSVIAVATLDREVWDETGLLGNDIARDLGEQHRWFFGPIGYVLRDVKALAKPVPCRGALGFWMLPADVEQRVLVQL